MPAPILWGNQFVIDNGPNNQLASIKIMALPDGGFVGVWYENQGGLRIQTFGADGLARSSEMRMPGEIASNSFDKVGITLLTDGGYVVSWTEHVPGGIVVQGAVFDSDGTVRRSAFTLSKEAQSRPPHSSVVALDDGGFMMLHEKVAAGSSDVNIYGRNFNAAGDLIRDDFIATGIVEENQFDASSVRLANGKIALLYSDSSPGSPALTVARLRILNQDGTAASSRSDIVVDTDFVNNPSIAALTDGRIVVVWKNPTGDIKARIFQQDGTPVGTGLISVNSTTNGTQNISAVSALSDGGFAVAFEDWGPSANRVYDIRVVTFNAAGVRQSDDILAHGVGTGAQANPSITTLADGRFVVSWVDLENPTNLNKGNLVGQIFDAREVPVEVNGTAGNDHYFGTSQSGDVLRGENGNDTLSGGGGEDTLDGGTGDDVLFGGPGTEYDRLIGGAGADTLDGGDGYDAVSYETAAGSILLDLGRMSRNTGDAQGDKFTSIEAIGGSAHNDTLIGSNGRDDFYGGDGNDILEGGEGNDSLIGEKGDDTLFAGAGNDTIYGGRQNGTDTDGWDMVSYQRAGVIVLNFITGTHGGAAAGDVFYDINAYVGSGSADAMIGADGGDVFYGDAHNDTLEGGGGNDLLFGQAGDDDLVGGAGDDVLNGGTGSNKAFFFGARSEYQVTRNANGSITVRDLDGSEGTDTLWDVRTLDFNDGVEVFNEAPTGLSLSSASIVENAPPRVVVGTLSAMDADGDRLTYTLLPGSSSAFAIDTASNSLVVNGPLDFEAQPSHQVTIQARDAYGGTTSLTVNITVTDDTDETTPFTIRGTRRADVLTGEAGNDTIYGSGGNDQLRGEAGHDKLYGGLGKDRMYGSTGKDVFVFDTKLNKRTNVDKIYDFKSRDDSIYLDNKVFTKLGKGLSKGKKFKADMFATGKKAKDAEDRIVYDKKTGALYYDQDGTGSKAQVKIATITNKTTLKYHDFFVI